VIAVVLTILVLDLGGEAISNAKTTAELDAALIAQWPTFVRYAISFTVVGLYWVSHQTYFTFIREVNETQLWLNLLLLYLCLARSVFGGLDWRASRLSRGRRHLRGQSHGQHGRALPELALRVEAWTRAGERQRSRRHPAFSTADPTGDHRLLAGDLGILVQPYDGLLPVHRHRARVRVPAGAQPGTWTIAWSHLTRIKG
jgi:hypothetical protein